MTQWIPVTTTGVWRLEHNGVRVGYVAQCFGKWWSVPEARFDALTQAHYCLRSASQRLVDVTNG